MGFFFFFLFIFLFIIFLCIAPMWIIYRKAGKPGWASIIPIYNTIVLLQIVDKPLWWFFMLIIPGVNIVFAIIIYNELSKSFGKGTGFTVGLLLLPIIFYPALAYGSATYIRGRE